MTARQPIPEGQGAKASQAGCSVQPGDGTMRPEQGNGSFLANPRVGDLPESFSQGAENMNTQYYFIHEARNVLFAHWVSPRSAASQFVRLGSIVLSTPADLTDLAARKRKLLHVTGLPLDPRPLQRAQPVLA